MEDNFYPEPFDQLTLEMCQSARRYFRILSPQLDHQVFDNIELSDAVSTLARRSPQSEIRILISDSRPLVQQGHRLLTLSRRIPSLVHIHVLKDHPEMTGETVVIRDLDGLLYKPGDSAHRGLYEPDSRAIAQDYIERFDALWQRSQSDPNLRQLGI